MGRNKHRKVKVKALRAIYGFRCAWCGVRLTNKMVTLDHIFPYSLGGRSVIQNLCLSCQPCNIERGQGRRRDDGTLDGQDIWRMSLRTLRFWLVPLEMDPCICSDENCTDHWAVCRRRKALHQVRQRIERLMSYDQRAQDDVVDRFFRKLRR